jgi:ketosteroid isomerase-like protein
MKTVTGFIIAAVLFARCTSTPNLAGSEQDRKALEQTSIGIRSAFSRGDVPTILSYHHPEIKKALGYKHIINGREELKKDLEQTFSHVKLTWLENKTESLIFNNNTAIEMTAYTIEVRPKNGDKPFTSKGRAMVVYIRSKESPTGWSSIRELIQPESE